MGIGFLKGNAFLLQASRAGADVKVVDPKSGAEKFRYPSYVEDIMGPMCKKISIYTRAI